jgi:hypothetical protein
VYASTIRPRGLGVGRFLAGLQRQLAMHQGLYCYRSTSSTGPTNPRLSSASGCGHRRWGAAIELTFDRIDLRVYR